MADTIHFLAVTQLQPNPFQPRSQMNKDELTELVESIKVYGILEPLVVAETPAGYQIIAGERRWRAAREAGLETVPALVKKTNPKGMLEMALVENVQRIDLTPIERAQAFQQLERDFNLSVNDIAEKIGKSAGYISNTVKLLQLPDAIKDGLLGGMITEGHARALSSIFVEKDQIECYKIVLKESASVRRTEELARRYRENAKVRFQTQKTVMQLDDKQVMDWQKKLQTQFNAKTKLKITRSAKVTRITLTFQGPPEQTQADLEKFIEIAE